MRTEICCGNTVIIMSDLAPPRLLSARPIPDASAGLQSSETVQTLSVGVAWRQLAASPAPSGEATAGLCPIARPAAPAGHTHPGLPVCSEEVTWAGCPGRSSYHQNQCAYMNLSIAVLMGTHCLHGLIHISVYRINTNFLLSNNSISFSIVSSVRMRSLKSRRSRRKLVPSTVHHWLTSSGFVFMEMSDVKPFRCRKTTFTGCYGFPPPCSSSWLVTAQKGAVVRNTDMLEPCFLSSGSKIVFSKWEYWCILISEIRIQCLLCTNTKPGNSYVSSELRDSGPCKDTVGHIVGQTWADR